MATSSPNADGMGHQSMNLLARKAPSKYPVVMGDPNETVKREISDLIDNFQKTFICYINENYGSFTEADV